MAQVVTECRRQTNRLLGDRRDGLVPMAVAEIQAEGTIEPRERLTPERTDWRDLPRLQPLDQRAEAWWLGKLRCPSGTHPVVDGKELVQKNQPRATVQQGVVRSPDELVAVLLEATQGEPEERRGGEVKSAATICEQKRLVHAPLVRRRTAAPILFFPGDGDVTMEELLRGVSFLPRKAGPQRVMALNQQLPGGAKRRDIERFGQIADELLDVGADVRGR